MNIKTQIEIEGQIYIVVKILPRERFWIKLFNPSGKLVPNLSDSQTFSIGNKNYVVTKSKGVSEFLIREIKPGTLENELFKVIKKNEKKT